MGKLAINDMVLIIVSYKMFEVHHPYALWELYVIALFYIHYLLDVLRLDVRSKRYFNC